jgi:hypothetical protein
LFVVFLVSKEEMFFSKDSDRGVAVSSGGHQIGSGPPPLAQQGLIEVAQLLHEAGVGTDRASRPEHNFKPTRHDTQEKIKRERKNILAEAQ